MRRLPVFRPASLVVAPLLAATLLNAVQTDTERSYAAVARPSIVLLLTDDQRADTLRYMPIVHRLLARRGVTFERAYVSNSVCCPSRTTILTGRYSHGTGVYSNKARRQYGGFPAFRDGSTVATWLHGAGYRTAMMGKYLNGYRGPYVPPGWDRWFATYHGGGFYDYRAIDDGTLVRYGRRRSDYGTTVLAEKADAFIRHTPTDRPLFLYWAVHAPHEPATPARRDRHAFASLPAWRPRSHDEPDVSDKPEHIQRKTMDGPAIRSTDRFRLRQLRSLLAVDRAVARIVDALRDTHRLRNTIIVFTSDNGMSWGEHRWTHKEVPYEESASVPLVVRYDALVSAPRVDNRHLIVNIDFAPTFAELAGVDAPQAEGLSFLRLLSEPSSPWRDAFLMEHLGYDDERLPTYCAVHTFRFVFVEYATGEEELYDLERDPLELRNRARSDRYRDERRALARRLVHLCSPPPPRFDPWS